MTINICIVVFCALIQLGVLIFNNLLNPTKKNSNTINCTDSGSTLVVVGEKSSVDDDDDVSVDNKKDPKSQAGQDQGDEMQVRRISALVPTYKMLYL